MRRCAICGGAAAGLISQPVGGRVLPDHYATLGIAPNAPREVIRAAYVKLMRRYHPDRNPSAAASAHVREVTAAYGVLGVPAKRARYDLERRQASVAPARPFTSERDPSLVHWFAAAIGIAVVAILVPLLTPDPILPEQANARTGAGGRQQPPLEVETEAMASTNPRTLCSSPAVVPLLKRGLFRRAARLRGSDVSTFNRLAEASHIRFTSPVLARPGLEATTISCTASVAIDLPPGVTGYSGRQSVTGSIAYSLKPSDGSSSGRMSLGAVGTLAELLATVQPSSPALAGAAPGGPEAAVDGIDSAGVPAADLARTTAPPAAPEAASNNPQRVVAKASPSFSCRVTSSWAAAVVCSSDQLASLDRRLASLYGNAMERADASQRTLLVRTDRRFLSRRDACSSEACVQSAYAAGMQEIEEIAAGRQRPR